MKDNISIIFTAIVGVFLIVILPLFSILDRQDSMSYNVVLTETTKYVDNIRNNGFIDNESYTNYISALGSTSNMYKVDIEIYRKRLIVDKDSGQDAYIEDIELYNTMDVLEVLGRTNSTQETPNTNKKNNVFLLNKDDEVYFKVYNTNVTMGSIIYNSFVKTNKKIIDISYGGKVNNINWELFDEINANVINVPEVLMEVPVNANNEINVMKVTDNGQLEEIDCIMFPELCQDGFENNDEYKYTYLYDLTYSENAQMTIAVELKNFDYLVVGENEDGTPKLESLAIMTESKFNSAKEYIIDNFIQLNEMFADIDLEYRENEDYYSFNIILKNVEIASSKLLSVFASVSILPGLGQDKDGALSLGAQSVRVELLDETSIHTVAISNPINWKKFIKTKNLTSSIINSGEVYVEQDIAFIISYTGIDETYDVKQAVMDNFSIHTADYTDLEFITMQELKEQHNIDLNTRRVGHMIVKFKYTSANTDKESNYVKLNTGWIQIKVDDDEDYKNEDYIEKPSLAFGTESSRYAVWIDGEPPVKPTILIDGIKGNGKWYIKENVNVILQPSVQDKVYKEGKEQIGGSGVESNTLTLTGATTLNESEISNYIIENEGTTSIQAKAYDYLGNVAETEIIELMLDKTAPAIPTIQINGTLGNNGWYTTDVIIKIMPGTDNFGLGKTTYILSGAQNTGEITVNETGQFTLSKNGIYQIVITAYDRAGNYAQNTYEIKIDKTIPPGVDINIEGTKNLEGWYNKDVKITLNVKANISPSGADKVKYQLMKLINEDTSQIVDEQEFKENIKEIPVPPVTQSGKYTLKVYTYNGAGTAFAQEFKFDLDNEAPNKPTISILSDYPIGDNGWYRNSVNVELKSNQDVGPSQEKSFSYVVKKDESSSNRFKITSPYTIQVKSDGEYEYTAYSLDYAGNQSSETKKIKIDQTPPTSASFSIKEQGKDNEPPGRDGWYRSNVDITIVPGADKNLAGTTYKVIDTETKKVVKSGNETVFPLDIEGEYEVIATTYDKAGNSTKSSPLTIGIDKTAPTRPNIKLPAVTGTGITGVSLYNKNVDIKIIPGKDTNVLETTYEVIDMQNGNSYIKEKTGTSLKIQNDGKYQIIARTYDKAGNSDESSKLIWINKDKPLAPQIVKINDQEITDNNTQLVTGSNNTVNIEFTNVSVGNKLKVTLIEGNDDKKEVEIDVEQEQQLVSIDLENEGVWQITAVQTNMFGTQSDTSTGNYAYQYEEIEKGETE